MDQVHKWKLLQLKNKKKKERENELTIWDYNFACYIVDNQFIRSFVYISIYYFKLLSFQLPTSAIVIYRYIKVNPHWIPNQRNPILNLSIFSFVVLSSFFSRDDWTITLIFEWKFRCHSAIIDSMVVTWQSIIKLVSINSWTHSTVRKI